MKRKGRKKKKPFNLKIKEKKMSERLIELENKLKELSSDDSGDEAIRKIMQIGKGKRSSMKKKEAGKRSTKKKGSGKGKQKIRRRNDGDQDEEEDEESNEDEEDQDGEESEKKTGKKKMRYTKVAKNKITKGGKNDDQDEEEYEGNEKEGLNERKRKPTEKEGTSQRKGKKARHQIEVTQTTETEGEDSKSEERDQVEGENVQGDEDSESGGDELTENTQATSGKQRKSRRRPSLNRIREKKVQSEGNEFVYLQDALEECENLSDGEEIDVVLLPPENIDGETDDELENEEGIGGGKLSDIIEVSGKIEITTTRDATRTTKKKAKELPKNYKNLAAKETTKVKDVLDGDKSKAEKIDLLVESSEKFDDLRHWTKVMSKAEKCKGGLQWNENMNIHNWNNLEKLQEKVEGKMPVEVFDLIFNESIRSLITVVCCVMCVYSYIF
jgi:hypothetical protein